MIELEKKTQNSRTYYENSSVCKLVDREQSVRNKWAGEKHVHARDVLL